MKSSTVRQFPSSDNANRVPTAKKTVSDSVTQEQNGIDFRNIYTFVINIHNKNEAYFAETKSAASLFFFLHPEIVHQEYGWDRSSLK